MLRAGSSRVKALRSNGPGLNVAGHPRVTRTDLKTGKVEILAEKYDGKPLVGPNDVTIDGKGRLYFTDLNAPAVYRIDAPGKLARILAPRMCSGRTAFRSHRTTGRCTSSKPTAQGGARLIRATTCRRMARSATCGCYYNFYPGRSADGMSIDMQGNLYASAGMNQLAEPPRHWIQSGASMSSRPKASC